MINNAIFHHGGRIKELMEAAGCSVVYLPPYSPDLNRIEKCWAWLKSRIRKQLRKTKKELRNAVESVFVLLPPHPLGSRYTYKKGSQT